MNHHHVSHILKVIEEALEPYEGVDMQRVSTRSSGSWGSSGSWDGHDATELNIEIIISHDKFEHSFEQAKELSAEAYRKEFLKILDDGA